MDRKLLDGQVSRICEQERFSGVIRVTYQDRICYEKSFGYANREQMLPFTEDSRFTLYSLSKPFCAIGLLLLTDQGLVDLDAHPGAYVPEAGGFDPRVTIRHMLHHTSGMPDFLMIPEFKENPPADHRENIRKYVQALSKYPQAFVPGTQDLYSNINFTLSALIIENVSGLPYPEYMDQRVFRPLGASTLTVDREGLALPNRVQGYRLSDSGQIEPTEKCHSWMLGGGDLVGRVEDVYCLHKAVKHRLLLKPETWEQVLTPDPVSSKGMGCTVTQWHGLTRITHNGGHRGFRSFHIHLPQEELDLILLSNAGYGKARQEVAEAVYRAFFDADAQAEKAMTLDYGLV